MQSDFSEAKGAPLASSAVSSVHASPLRIALLGCTNAPAHYLVSLMAHPAVRLVALADADKFAARAWSRPLGSKFPLFENLSALFAEVPELDAVLIASPLAERGDQIAACARAQKAMLCALPLAATLAETDAALTVAAENGVLLMPALPRRFDSAAQEMTRRAEEGALSTLRQARCDWRLPALGVTQEFSAEAKAGDWNLLLPQIACQTIDLCRWWLGDALTVSADIDTPEITPGGRRRQQEAFANIIVAHERGQSIHQIAQARSTRTDERYKLTGAQGHFELTLGTNAATTASDSWLTLHRPDFPPETIPTPDEAERAPGPPPDFLTACFRRLLTHFAECLHIGCVPRVRGADARAALEVLAAAYLSTQEGHKVSLPLRRSPAAPS